ncbi:ABC transporter substrate-binding protein [Saprospira grandis]|uniref:ABC transporter substrate-binding protein n=1 Tax=Saprospira grandis TaxID=1008 RepID=UPI0022DE16D9|nr:ABC transporter substrate-binding protein [Saprospira grandis]WBM75969.1 ABC transporter substrate-binding protein [Saprospira grandis]
MRYFLPFLALLLFACQGEAPTSSQEETQSSSSLELRQAQGFKVRAIENGQYLVEIDEQRFCLYPRTLKISKRLENYQYLPYPLKRVVCKSSPAWAMIELLDERKSVVGISDARDFESPYVKYLPELGREQLNYEALLLLSPELVVGYGAKADPKLADLNIPELRLKEYAEASPLAQMEWIRLFGLLFEKDEIAQNFVNERFAAYEELKQLAQKAQTRPSVLLGSQFGGGWYLAGGKSFMAQYLADAQANYLWKDLPGKEGVPLDFEAVLAKGQKADYWLNVGSYRSFEELRANNPRYALFQAFQQKKIYNYYGYRFCGTGRHGFFESGTIYPDEVLGDLIHIFHPELLPNWQLHYYYDWADDAF